MTILSKKKNIQPKQEGESSDSSNHIQNSHPHSLPNPLVNVQCSDDDLYTPRDNLESGPSHGKRRHRSSPLRTCSRSLKHRGSPSHNSSSTLAIAGPSTEPCGFSSGDDYGHSHNAQHTGGYNSGDEYDHSHNAQLSEDQWVEEDRLFEKKMRKRGLYVKKMGEDGACLFRAVADQIYGDQEMHGVVRKHCMDYIALNGDYFSHYVTEDFNTYVNRKRLDGTHGNHIEMQALSEMYNRTIEVFCYGKDPINIFHGVERSDNEPIRLSYHRGSHYNSIVDPQKATIGVGLGLPSFAPGSAEANQLNDAIRQSEEFHIEQAMLQDKLRATDWEATNDAIEQQVYRDSYLQFIRDNESRKKSMETPGVSTANENGIPKPAVSGEKLQCSQKENEYKTFCLHDWDEAGILAQVLAESQQEYLDNLKKALTSDYDENMHEKPSTSIHNIAHQK